MDCSERGVQEVVQNLLLILQQAGNSSAHQKWFSTTRALCGDCFFWSLDCDDKLKSTIVTGASCWPSNTSKFCGHVLDRNDFYFYVLFMSEIHLSRCVTDKTVLRIMSSSRILTTMGEQNELSSETRPVREKSIQDVRTTRNIIFVPPNRDRAIAMDSFQAVTKASRYYRGREEWWPFEKTKRD